MNPFNFENGAHCNLADRLGLKVQRSLAWNASSELEVQAIARAHRIGVAVRNGDR